ncbi:metal-dependent transcriptional regulator [candidate division WOR-3 bacterium]|nr:metal-dependent transcriptional regulator [candidate division WOR-3 bacterium]MCK4527816.1 metal-dependent transcriptional regulator [candidate division WOR-3 bacterium]
MKLTQSLEDYLEAILLLKKERDVVRVKDIGDKLGVRAASVVGAIESLEEKGFVEHERYGYVYLTESGKKRAEAVYKRHKSLFKFLTEILGVSHEVAERDACNIEHQLSKETFSKLLDFLNFVNKCPEDPRWLRAFKYFQEKKELPENCKIMLDIDKSLE